MGWISKKTMQLEKEISRLRGRQEATEEFQKLAIITVATSIIGGLFALARVIMTSGYTTFDFVLGFVVGAAASAGIGFGFGIIYMLRNQDE